MLKTYAGRYPIDLAIHFRQYLAETDFRRIIADKIYISERVVHTLEDQYSKESDKTTKLIFKHQILHQNAELEWLKNIIETTD